MKLSTLDSKATRPIKAFVSFIWPTVIFPFLFPPQASVCPPYFEVLITTSTWRYCFRIWTQSLSIKNVVGLWGVGTQRRTVGQHQHSTVTAMGGDPQWLSSKLTVISLVDTLTCPGPVVSKKTRKSLSHVEQITNRLVVDFSCSSEFILETENITLTTEIPK